jgi:8-oxo-dGTP pyrophosphatase MutT (NUDIX family)
LSGGRGDSTGGGGDGGRVAGRVQGDARLAWRRERSERVADCRVFQVRRDWSADPRGRGEHDFYVIEAPDWVNVIPVTKSGEVVLIELYRHGSGEVSLEIPGGMVDPGEEPRETAARELLEETGYEAREVVPLGRMRPNPAIQDNWLHTFLARDVERRGEPSDAGTEQTRVRLVPAERIPALIAAGEITHSLVVAGFHLLGLSEAGAFRGGAAGRAGGERES